MNTLEAQPAQTHTWYQLWWDVWTLPGTDTFRALMAETNGGAGRGFLWILVSGLISAIVNVLLRLALPNNALSNLPAGSLAIYQSVGTIGSFICIPISSVIGIAITAGIYLGLARLLGGRGDWGQAIFCYAAIQGPLVLIGLALSAPVSMLGGATNSLSYMLAIFSVLASLALSIYASVLYVFAIKAVEGIGTGKAILVMLLPTLLFLAAFACLFVGVLAPYLAKLH
jgi:hypothetical protein